MTSTPTIIDETFHETASYIEISQIPSILKSLAI